MNPLTEQHVKQIARELEILFQQYSFWTIKVEPPDIENNRLEFHAVAQITVSDFPLAVDRYISIMQAEMQPHEQLVKQVVHEFSLSVAQIISEKTSKHNHSPSP